jgi:Domain of unknown function (DUF4114)/RTX calcium-binding nonapeptide repeat (4 copies)
MNITITSTDPQDLILTPQNINAIVTGDDRENILDGRDDGGNNQILGAAGNDIIYAGFNDQLAGDAGNDTLDATRGRGSNKLSGGTGDDILLAGTNDLLVGDAGNDTLDASQGTGRNRLFGGIGDDELFAGINDLLAGDAGSDTLDAGVGGNTLTGGNGRDRFILADTTLPISVNTITDFKAGSDTLALVNIASINSDITRLTATIQGGDTLLKLGNVDIALLKGIQANSINDVLRTPTSPFKPLSNNVVQFTTDVDSNLVKFSPVSRQGVSLDEIGVFVVDDTLGRINGLTAQDTGYALAAIDRSQVIFSTLTSNFFEPTAVRNLSFASDQNLRFYAINGATTADVKADIAAGRTPTKLTIGDANELQIATSNNQLSLNWLKLNSKLVLQAGLSSDAPTLGTSLQGQQDLIDLRNINRSVAASFTLQSDASYRDQVGFYVVDDAVTGRIGTLQPGDVGYAAAAVRSSVVNIDKGQATGQFSLTGNQVLAPYLIANGTASDFLAPTNPSTSGVNAYFAYLGANSDKIDHIRLLGDNRFGFEDLAGGGDQDFNDVVLQVKLQ